MINRDELTYFMNNLLRISDISDSSLNGLQVQGCDQIKRIALGVSASLALFEKAAALNCQAIIVHHGLFWNKMDFRLQGVLYDRVRFLIERKINLYGYHLPLDLHPQLGNNAALIGMLPAMEIFPFGDYHGLAIGYHAQLDHSMDFDSIIQTYEKNLGQAPLAVYKHGKSAIQSVAVVSGGAADLVHEALIKKMDLFITGETAEYAQELTREGQINYLALGHYASEKEGVKKLGEAISNQYHCQVEFIDVANSF